MVTKSKDAAQGVYEMLKFQYQPLLDMIDKHAPADFKRKFNAASASMKISILDRLAAEAGL